MHDNPADLMLNFSAFSQRPLRLLVFFLLDEHVLYPCGIIAYGISNHERIVVICALRMARDGCSVAAFATLHLMLGARTFDPNPRRR